MSANCGAVTKLSFLDRFLTLCIFLYRLRCVLVVVLGIFVLLCPAPAIGQSNASPVPSDSVAAVGQSDFLHSLTEAERVWLHQHPVIRVAQDPSWPPIEFTDAHGSPSGMTADYLTLIEQRLGLKFERVPNLSWQEAYERMKRWEIDMTTTVAVTPERETFWAFTKPYMNMPIGIVTRGDVAYIADLRELEGRKVVVVEGYVANIWISHDFPEIELVRVRTTEEALRMLQRGEVFACVENMLVVGHYLAELKISNLKIAGTTPYTNAQCMAVRKDWSPLAGILDKALDSVSQPERNAIYRKWLPLRYEYGFAYSRLLPVAAIVTIFLLGLAAWKWKRVDKGRGVIAGDGRLKRWQAYLFTISATAVTFGFRLALDGQLGGQPSLVIFILPIMLSAYLGGLRAGLLSTVISYLGASYYLLPPIHSFAVASGVHRWQQFFVVLAGVFISGICARLHQARERAELAPRELREAEDRVAAVLAETEDLRAALDEHAIVAITNPQGKITFVNDKFCAISKYSREELLGRDHRIINSGFHSKEFMRDLWTTIARGKVWQGEIRNRAKDGTFYWLATTIVPLLNADGKSRQYVAIRVDMTARKEAEAALRESKGRLRKVIDGMGPFMFVGLMTPDGVLIEANRPSLEAAGLQPENVLDKPFPETYWWAWSKAVQAQLLAAIARAVAGVPSRYDVQLRVAEATLIWVDFSLFPVHGPGGEVIFLVPSANIIEERKKAEATVQQLNADLEQRVIERTAQIEAANKELEAFSYSVSHDLRAPLRAVNGFSNIVLDAYAPQLPAKAREYLEDIRAGAEQMGQLIDDLLAFSHLGRQAIKSQPVNMVQLVQIVLDEHAAQREGRPFEIKIGALPACQGDPALLKQVWVNLIANAIKYTRGRTPALIEIGCERNDDEIVYFACDNGIGFDMRYVHKLFGVFQRLHRTDEFEGAGVGLAIVQRIVHRHGGRVWAEAEAGRGARFRFTLEKEKVSRPEID